MDILGVNKTEARSVLNNFCRAGYLEAKQMGGVMVWSTTLKGNALANAALRTVKRATAQRQLEDLLERVRAYNADTSKIHSVSRVIVFGSYLDPEQQDLGDIDIAFSVVRRFEGDEYQKRRHIFMKQTKRNFKDFFERLCWPELELHYWLKG